MPVFAQLPIWPFSVTFIHLWRSRRLCLDNIHKNTLLQGMLIEFSGAHSFLLPCDLRLRNGVQVFASSPFGHSLCLLFIIGSQAIFAWITFTITPCHKEISIEFAGASFLLPCDLRLRNYVPVFASSPFGHSL